MSDSSCESLFKPYVSVQNALLLLALIFTLALFKMTSSEYASWVQAIGSIMAILGAFSISNAQLQRQHATKEKESRGKALAFKAVVKCTVDHAVKLGTYVGATPPLINFKSAWENINEDTVEAATNSLRVLPAHELGNFDLVVSHNKILGAMLRIRKDCRKLIDEPGMHNILVSDVYTSILGQCKLIEMYWADFEAASS